METLPSSVVISNAGTVDFTQRYVVQGYCRKVGFLCIIFFKHYCFLVETSTTDVPLSMHSLAYVIKNLRR